MTKIIKELYNQTDKSSDKWDWYFDVYQRHLGKYEGKNITFVEVGVQKGGSLEMWSNFFGPESKIYGIDIDPECAELKYDNPNISIIIGDQEDPNFWDKVLQDIGPIDVFLDDGGHGMNQQIVTFEKVWPLLNQNGSYICEDTHTSYFVHYQSSYKSQNSFIEYAKDFVDILHLSDTSIYTDHPVEAINVCDRFYQTRDTLVNKHFADDISSVHFYDSIVIFEKDVKFAKKRATKDI